MGVNPPTAYLLLTDIVKLPRGSWVIQNGANSGVERAVIAIAKLLGLKTINIVRRQQVVDETKALGGDVVLVDEPELAKRVAADTGNAPIMLALNGVGGTSTMNLMSTLFEGALLVSYGRMSRQPMAVQPGSRIFKKQTLRGFRLLDWYRSAEPEAIKVLFDHLVSIIAAGKLSTPVIAAYGFDQFREAISKAAQGGGKVLFMNRGLACVL
jgi:NADPH:quinone reductase-like Zn-dependent oxidoreductase